MQISRVAPLQQCFDAHFVVRARFIGGALDPDLSRPSTDFPYDQAGCPTLRPSAAWFLEKIDFNNALSYQVPCAQAFATQTLMPTA